MYILILQGSLSNYTETVKGEQGTFGFQGIAVGDEMLSSIKRHMNTCTMVTSLFSNLGSSGISWK